MRKYINRKMLLVLPFAALLAGGLVFYFFFYSSSPKDNKPYDEGVNALETRDYSLALAKFKESINTDPSLTNGYIQAADILLLKNQDAQAIEVLQKGDGFAKDQAAIFQKIADIYAHQADFEKALEYSDRAVGAGGNAASKKDKAGYLALLGRNDEAKKEADGISGGDAYSHFLQSIVSYKDLGKAREHAQSAAGSSDEEKYKELKEKLDELEEAEDNNVMNYMEIANIAIKYNEGPLALVLLNDVKTTNKYYEGAYIYEAYVRLSYGDYAKTLELLKSASLYAPNNQDIPKLMAEVYYEQQDFENANKSIQKALSFAQPSNDSRELGYLIYTARKDHTKALQQIEVLVKAAPDNYSYARLKFKALIALEKYKDAETYLDKFISEHSSTLTNEQEAVLLSFSAYSQYKQNEKKEAKDSFAKAEALYAYNAEVKYYYGLFYAGQGESATADEYFQDALNFDTTGEIIIKQN